MRELIKYFENIDLNNLMSQAVQQGYFGNNIIDIKTLLNFDKNYWTPVSYFPYGHIIQKGIYIDEFKGKLPSELSNYNLEDVLEFFRYFRNLVEEDYGQFVDNKSVIKLVGKNNETIFIGYKDINFSIGLQITRLYHSNPLNFIEHKLTKDD